MSLEADGFFNIFRTKKPLDEKRKAEAVAYDAKEIQHAHGLDIPITDDLLLKRVNAAQEQKKFNCNS